MSESSSWASVETATTDTSTYYQTSTRKPTSEMDKDSFLQLLITQMRYQDPLSPMDNKDSMAQLAQFSALEQMQNVASAMYQTQAYSMLGQTVMGNVLNEETGEYELIVGTCDAVTKKNGETYLLVGEKELPLAKVEGVMNNPQISEQLGLINSNIAALQSMDLIGKTVLAQILNEDGSPKEIIENMVDYVKIIDGRTILMVGGKEVYPEEVLSVSNERTLLGKMMTASSEGPDGIITKTGPLEAISVSSDGSLAYAQIGGEKFFFDKISDLSLALSYVNKTVNLEEGTGVVTGVHLNSGKIFIQVDNDMEYELSDFKELNN